MANPISLAFCHKNALIPHALQPTVSTPPLVSAAELGVAIAYLRDADAHRDQLKQGNAHTADGSPAGHIHIYEQSNMYYIAMLD